MSGKTLFFDIDGTIWDFHNRIPDSTRETFRLLKKNGHQTFLCTGRARAFIQHPSLFELGMDGIVSGCGTMIEWHDREIFYKEMDPAFVERTMMTLRKFRFRPILEGKNFLYMDDADFVGDPYGVKLHEEIGHNLLTIQGEWGKWEVSKLSCATEDADVEGCYQALNREFEWIQHNEPVVEMVPKGFTKGTGILETCRLLGLDPDGTFAFGDSANDLEMLRTAAVGIAMGNGTEPAKQAADYVTADMDQDGIYLACKHFGLI